MEARPAAAPPTAYDAFRVCLPGIDEVARALAERARAAGHVAITREDVTAFVPAIRYVEAYVRRLELRGWSFPDAATEGDLVLLLLLSFGNHELHRRKTFWVDPPLAWMLAQTSLDIEGELVRLPFPSCAFVFTDPETRALADELRDSDAAVRKRTPTRVVTLYLTQGEGVGARSLEVVAAFDRGDGDWPYLLARDLWIEPRARLDAILDSHFPGIDPGQLDAVFSSDPMKRLLELAINAVLYATSAGVEPVLLRGTAPVAAAKKQRARAARREAERQARRASADDVFFLPGKIDIRRVQQLRSLRDRGDGQRMLARFMVRGHWRRANPSWEDQRPRWIEPYWKGPELAAVIEKEYRLRE